MSALRQKDRPGDLVNNNTPIKVHTRASDLLHSQSMHGAAPQRTFLQPQNAWEEGGGLRIFS